MSAPFLRRDIRDRGPRMSPSRVKKAIWLMRATKSPARPRAEEGRTRAQYLFGDPNKSHNCTTPSAARLTLSHNWKNHAVTWTIKQLGENCRPARQLQVRNPMTRLLLLTSESPRKIQC